MPPSVIITSFAERCERDVFMVRFPLHLGLGLRPASVAHGDSSPTDRGDRQTGSRFSWAAGTRARKAKSRRPVIRDDRPRPTGLVDLGPGFESPHPNQGFTSTVISLSM